MPNDIEFVSENQAAERVSNTSRTTTPRNRSNLRGQPYGQQIASLQADDGLSDNEIKKALSWYRQHRSLYPEHVVVRIQHAIGVEDDGIIGQRTVKAIARWQRDNGLTPDGIAGVSTLTKMFGDDIRPGKGKEGGVDRKIDDEEHGQADTGGLQRPHGYQQIIKVFGKPGMNIVTQSMRAGPNGEIINVRCHKLLAPIFKKVFDEIYKEGLSHCIKSFDGCYVYRRKKRGGSWSTHAWGIAIDINASGNPMVRNKRNMKITDGQKAIAPIFEKYGFYWGAAFGDPMHFQYCTGY